MPGRLNQTSVIVEREGVFYGQCSELCGTIHGSNAQLNIVSFCRYQKQEMQNDINIYRLTTLISN